MALLHTAAATACRDVDPLALDATIDPVMSSGPSRFINCSSLHVSKVVRKTMFAKPTGWQTSYP